MNLEILLPFRVFATLTDVSSIVAETREGSFGLLPHRRDCVAALSPGILTYTTPVEGTVYVAVDEGVMAKTGLDVVVSVRHAIGGATLERLHDAVTREFLAMDGQARTVRVAMASLEAGVMRRVIEYRHGR